MSTQSQVMATLSELVKRFPKCFMPPGEPKLPISVGIVTVIRIAAPEIDHRDLANALREYCGDSAYLRGLVAGAPRVNLEGNAAGVVSERHAAWAARQLRKRSIDSAERTPTS